MTVWTAIIIGTIQGLTEFLPVSSSGHLVILEHLFKVKDLQLLLNVAVHFGTILAVIYFFRQDLLKLINGFFKGTLLTLKTGELKKNYLMNVEFKISIAIIIGSIPAALVGFTLKDYLEQSFSSVFMTGLMLMITGIFLYFTKFAKKKVERNNFTLKIAIIIGTAQAFALLPGISRSGSTIATALLLGVEREWAARFSFLLSVPAIVGASLLESVELKGLPSDQILMIIAGVISAAIVGYASLALLMRIIKHGNFHYFSYYCFAIGLLAVTILYKL